MLGFIIRNGKCFSTINPILLLYYAFVRSRLEYASTVWSPYYDVHVAELECVQRRFLKYCHFFISGTYPCVGFPHNVLLTEFGVSTLASRRAMQSTAFLAKIISGEVDCSQIVNKLIYRVPRPNSRARDTFYLPATRTNLLKQSPLYQMCNTYNCITDYIDIFNDSQSQIRHHSLRPC